MSTSKDLHCLQRTEPTLIVFLSMPRTGIHISNRLQGLVGVNVTLKGSASRSFRVEQEMRSMQNDVLEEVRSAVEVRVS